MPPDRNRTHNRRKIEQGRKFEQLAAQFYRDQGFELLEKNWRVGHKEIDLIVRRDQLIIFVEVKSSYSKQYGHPIERVDQRKIANLSQAAHQYLIAKKIDKSDLRFDVVTFVDGQLEHFPNAFEVNPGD